MTFVLGWWHVGDHGSAAEVLTDSLRAIGLDEPVDVAAIDERLTALGVDEEDVRRHQIGWVVRRANQALRGKKLRAFADSADEPEWRLVTPAEHSRLLEELGPPEGIEAQWDDPVAHPDPLAAATRPSGVRIPRSPAEAFTLARTAMRSGDHATALAAAEVSDGDSGHGLLARLIRIAALKALGRAADARTLWASTARTWLAGTATIWRSQWSELERLHGGPEDALIAEVRARKPLAPRMISVEVSPPVRGRNIHSDLESAP